MKNKGPKKETVKRSETTVFLYTSACCSVSASNNREGQEKGMETLGSWRCEKCNKPCSVSRMLNKSEEK